MKKTFFAVLVCFILLSSGVVGFDVNNQNDDMSKGTTLYVGGIGSGNYSSIQDAIDNASSGDTVYVYSGIYYENVIVNKSIKLLGEDKNNTIIDANFNGTVVYATADEVTLTGFTIQNSETNFSSWDFPCGIKLNFVKNSLVEDNIVKDNFLGIVMNSSSMHNTVRRNIVTDNLVGIYMLFNSNFTTIEDNIINNNEGGICHFESHNTTMIDNVISNNYEGISIYYSRKCTVENNIIESNSDYGISIRPGTDNNTVVRNHIVDNGDGIYMTFTGDNNISENTISFNHDAGILLPYCSRNKITHNVIDSNACEGLAFYLGQDNVVSNNTIKNNDASGLFLQSIHGYSISDNYIINNDIGVFLNSSAHYNIIVNNMVVENHLGIKIDFEVYSSNGYMENQIYQNSFIKNDDTISYFLDGYMGANNTWDNGFFGNYWDDYKTIYPDAHRIWLNGTWNQPYVISEGVQDNCPLIVPHRSPYLFVDYLLHLWDLITK